MAFAETYQLSASDPPSFFRELVQSILKFGSPASPEAPPPGQVAPPVTSEADLPADATTAPEEPIETTSLPGQPTESSPDEVPSPDSFPAEESPTPADIPSTEASTSQEVPEVATTDEGELAPPATLDAVVEDSEVVPADEAPLPVELAPAAEADSVIESEPPTDPEIDAPAGVSESSLDVTTTPVDSLEVASTEPADTSLPNDPVEQFPLEPITQQLVEPAVDGVAPETASIVVEEASI